MSDPKVGETFEAAGFVFTCVGHTPDGAPIPGHPCWPVGKPPRIKVVTPDGTTTFKQFPAPPTVEKPAKAPRQPAAQQSGTPAETQLVSPIVARPTAPAQPRRAKNYSTPRRYNRYARKEPAKIVIHQEPMSAGAVWGWVLVLALIVALVWGLNVRQRQNALDGLMKGAEAIRAR